MQKTNREVPIPEEGVQPGASNGHSIVYSTGRTLLLSSLFALAAGLLASLLAIVVMGILRLAAGVPTPVELFGDYVLKHIDVSTFIHLLDAFRPNGKTGPLGLALLCMVGLGVLLGLLYAALTRVRLPARGYRPGRREWLVALSLALSMTLLGCLLFNDELRQNFFGLPLTWSIAVSALGLLADFSIYAIALCLAYRALLPKQVVEGVAQPVQDRRLLLARAGVAALSVGGAGAAYGLVNKYLGEFTIYDGMKTAVHGEKTAPITPNSEHYIVTQNVVDPDPDPALWSLELTGLIQKPGVYTYAEVQQLPSTSRPITLECIANAVGNHLIGTAVWQGVPLQTLLDRHGGALPNATHVAFYSVDGYNVSLPLKEVLEAEALLAWHMNGAEIPVRHGFPMRVLIPGRYGEENPKWLTHIELTDHFIGGLYADQGWYNGQLHTMSRIDRPESQDKVQRGQTIEMGGIAYAGHRGIQMVELSADGGQTWQQAQLKPQLSQDAWVLWTWKWTPITVGKYTLVCRATDGTGTVQTDKVQGTVPNGAKGYHKVVVEAV
ncbi:MAG: hypothetical protein NVSMB44_17730 [Ktedonobacteraceae bacterium]